MVLREWGIGRCAYYGPAEMMLFGALCLACGLGLGYVLAWYI